MYIQRNGEMKWDGTLVIYNNNHSYFTWDTPTDSLVLLQEAQGRCAKENLQAWLGIEPATSWLVIIWAHCNWPVRTCQLQCAIFQALELANSFEPKHESANVQCKMCIPQDNDCINYALLDSSLIKFLSWLNCPKSLLTENFRDWSPSLPDTESNFGRTNDKQGPTHHP